MKKPNYEKLPEEQYEIAHEKYEKRGLKIPNGAEVVMTDWALQNGLKMKERKCIKIRNGRSEGTIMVLKSGNKTPDPYWAGFWKAK